MFKTSRPANPRILLPRILLGLLDFFVFLSLNKSTPHKKDDDMCFFWGACFFWWPCLKKNWDFYCFILAFFRWLPAGGSSQLISNLFMPCRTGFLGSRSSGWMATGLWPPVNAVQFNQGSWLINTPENPPKLSVQQKVSLKYAITNLRVGTRRVYFVS